MRRACVVVVAAALAAACGKKGPPLPPLLKVPRAPADFTAERRGPDVRVQFTVPSANTDGTKPANVERVEIYRFTGPSTATDEQVMKFGTRVATVAVKAPRNPDITTEADEPEEEPDLEGEGMDQGVIAQLEDALGPAAYEPVELPKDKRSKTADSTATEGPLVGPPATVASTMYIAVGFNKRGRKGPLTRRVVVPLVPPPPAPSSPMIQYDEMTVTVTWEPTTLVGLVQEPATEDLLPSRFISFTAPTLGYHVYDVSPAATPAAADAQLSAPGPLRLTAMPVTEAQYEDTRIAWGTTRCYTVRTVETITGLSLESDAPSPQCTTLQDTFPPAAPKGLRAVATERAISLIWDPNDEKDLAGYLVLRGTWPGETLASVTPMPISETSFSDTVQPGMRYVYAVEAVDKAGNVGPMSNRAEETSR